MEKETITVTNMLALALLNQDRDKVFVSLERMRSLHLKDMLIVVGLGIREREIREFTW
jgi:hypothetical protein